MIKKISALLKSDALRELIVYGIVGVLTTLVNIFAFALLTRGGAESALWLTCANVIANVLSIVFAFFANKRFVFKSRSWETRLVWKEAAQFALARVFAMLLDVGMVNLCVIVLGMDKMIAKVLANVLVIIVNYITGKLWVFRRK